MEITDPSKFLKLCAILGMLLEDDPQFQKRKQDFFKRKEEIKNQHYLRIERPLEHKQQELSNLEFNVALVEETKKILDENGGQLPRPWEGYIAFIATTMNVNERRIRRIFRKAGLYTGG